jgi:tetratricopeptide (TPR) repeat protein
MRTLIVFAFFAAALLAGCSGAEAPPEEMLPPPPSRQSDLTRLYDTMCTGEQTAAEAAARQAAAGDDTDIRFMASLWGSRPRTAEGARRFGAALARTGKHQLAYDWYERAFLFVDSDDPRIPWLRYEMAQEYVALDRKQEAINLLSNRMGTYTLPPELKQKYDELVGMASR